MCWYTALRLTPMSVAISFAPMPCSSRSSTSCWRLVNRACGLFGSTCIVGSVQLTANVLSSGQRAGQPEIAPSSRSRNAFISGPPP